MPLLEIVCTKDTQMQCTPTIRNFIVTLLLIQNLFAALKPLSKGFFCFLRLREICLGKLLFGVYQYIYQKHGTLLTTR